MLMAIFTLNVPAHQQRSKNRSSDEKCNAEELSCWGCRHIDCIMLCNLFWCFDMKRVSAKFILKLLNLDQNDHRMNIAQELLNNFMRIQICSKELLLLTKNEYCYDVETRIYLSQWKRSGEQKWKKVFKFRPNVKVLLPFFYYNSAVHHEFLPLSRRINTWKLCTIYGSNVKIHSFCIATIHLPSYPL